MSARDRPFYDRWLWRERHREKKSFQTRLLRRVDVRRVDVVTVVLTLRQRKLLTVGANMQGRGQNYLKSNGERFYLK